MVTELDPIGRLCDRFRESDSLYLSVRVGTFLTGGRRERGIVWAALYRTAPGSNGQKDKKPVKVRGIVQQWQADFAEDTAPSWVGEPLDG